MAAILIPFSLKKPGSFHKPYNLLSVKVKDFLIFAILPIK